MRDDERTLHRVAATQHGTFSRGQVLGTGLTPRVVDRRLGSGRWDRLAPGVYGLAWHRDTWRRRLWVAHLHAGEGSAIGRESAARLRGFEQVRAGQVVVAVPAGRRHPPPGVAWFRVEDLIPEDVEPLDGLPVTTAARTAVDLAAVLRPTTLRLLVESGVVARRFRLEEVGAVLDRVRRRGRPGVTRLADVLDDLGPGDGIPRSELERLLDVVVDRAGLPRPVHEHPLPGQGALDGFVDRCWPSARLIVEADGRKWHTRRQQILRDHDRDLQAHAAGYLVVRLLWEHLAHDPEGTARSLRRIHEERLALISGGTR